MSRLLPKKDATLHLRMPSDVRDELKKEGVKQMRTMSDMAVLAIIEGLKVLKKRRTENAVG